jgi:acyl-ACP thioesterase
MTHLDGAGYVADYKIYGYEISPRGYMQPAALARFAQHCASDELAFLSELGLPTHEFTWVVRRNVIGGWRNISGAGTLRAVRRITGVGACWLESRTDFRHGGPEQAGASVRTFWVQLDSATGKPAPISEVFADFCRTAHGTEGLMWRSEIESRPTVYARIEDIPVREADYDLLGHVNNSAYFDLIEPLVADGDEICVEYDSPIRWGTTVVRLRSVDHGDRIAFTIGPVDAPRSYCSGSVRRQRAAGRREN